MLNIYNAKLIGSKEWEKKTGIKITRNHLGKMEGAISINTSPLNNPRCLKRCQIDGAICGDCFSMKQLSYRANNKECYQRNGDILGAARLEVAPVINALYFRFEAFGDLLNETHLINYYIIAANNPRATFALWPKNIDIVARAARAGYPAPDNVIIIQSSIFKNRPCIKSKYANKIFTVWTKKGARDNDITINCGARHCMSCLQCYEKNNGIDIINELKK